MIYSAGCEYAIRAITRLAQQAPAGEFCLLRDLRDGNSFPEHFVGKLLQALVKSGILASAKGRGGGFALRRPPHEITLRQIVDAIDGRDRIERCILGLSVCNEHQPCPQHDAWTDVRRQINAMLDRTTLAELVEALNRKEGHSDSKLIQR
jgi:Rrf2 family iron-sulfur cluster assembly transcriptional regulator